VATISIVVPVYYNELSLKALAARLSALARVHPEYDFEFVYVDDGSGDGSYRVLAALAKKDKRVKVVKLARNFGSNTAILAGMAHARGDCVGFLAADLQDPPEALTEMIHHWEEGNKVVLAVRKDRHGDPWLTRLFAGIFNRLFKRLVFDGFSPQGVGFFLIDGQVAKVLLSCREKNAHIIGLILWSGFERTIVEYDRGEREHGRSRWTFWKKVKYFTDAFTAFSYLPLRVASTLGLILAGLGGVYALIVIAVRVLHGTVVPGWSALMVTVLLLSGVQLMIMGILGEYLWRTFDATRQRPLFVVEDGINLSSQTVSWEE
jgi:dolichol-phosphate mannosyltransferase